MTGFNLLHKFLILFALCLFPALPCFAEDINIPLTVHEALNKEIKGINRTGGPVTVGIPFPKGILHEKDGALKLSLQGVQDYQFRTLAKWPDNSVKWALIDFQADIRTGSSSSNIKVTRGDGNSSAKNLAKDADKKIIIDTGVMYAEISKTGFNLFDKVILNGRELVLTGASKGVLVLGREGEEYYGSAGVHEVTIEENGPVRTVIKAEGAHNNGAKRMMDYTVRMHFFKNSSRVNVFYTLKNANKKQFEHVYIRSLSLINKMDANAPLEIKTANHDGVTVEKLNDKNDTISFYQAVSDFPQVYKSSMFYKRGPIPPDMTRKKEWGFMQEGYWIKKNDKLLFKGKRSEYPDLAYLDISDSQGAGVTIGVRFAAGMWPKSLRAYGDGTVEIGLWPKDNEVGYWIRYGSHNTFEIMYDFHSSHTDPEQAMKKFQYPLVAKAPVDWYNKCVSGIYPLYNFVSFDNENDLISRNRWEHGKGIKERNVKMKAYRYFYWGGGGFDNQHDFARIALVNFLRDENIKKSGMYYLYAQARFNYNTDWSIFHTDEYYLQNYGQGTIPKENREYVDLAKVVFEIEHMHWYGLPLYYYLTGDERIKDAVIDWGEVIKSWAEKSWVFVYERFFGWEMYSLAAMYDFTGDLSFMELADRIFQKLLVLRLNEENPSHNLFINWDRGYIMRGKVIKPGLMTGYIIFDGLYNYYLHMDDKNPLKERVVDVLEGVSDFMYREPYVEGVKKTFKGDHWAFWLYYSYNNKDKDMSKPGYYLILQAFYANLAPYLFTGETKWLERMDKIIRSAAWDNMGVWEQFTYLDHPGLQSIMYTRLHPREDLEPPQAINDLNGEVKVKNVILTWTAPKDAVRYQIKYSNKKLVESLGYNPDEKKYKYDPSGYANWWAGENISNEPYPGSPGTKQSMTINGLKPGRYYFAIRSWDTANNRSNISNLAEMLIK